MTSKESANNEVCESDSSAESESGSFQDEPGIADLAGYTPEERHRPGMIALLNQMFREHSADSSKLADIIIQQRLGAVVVMSEEDEDEADDEDWDSGVFGMAAIINFALYESEEGVKQLRAFIAKQAKEYGSEEDSAAVSQILNGDAACLFLISEKMVNLPPDFTLIPLEYVEELKLQAHESGDGDTTEEDEVIICILKMYKKSDENDMVYIHPEQKAIADHAIRCVDYPVDISEFGSVFVEGESEEDPGEDCPPFRRICFISSKVFRSTCIPALKEKVQELNRSSCAD